MSKLKVILMPKFLDINCIVSKDGFFVNSTKLIYPMTAGEPQEVFQFFALAGILETEGTTLRVTFRAAGIPPQSRPQCQDYRETGKLGPKYLPEDWPEWPEASRYYPPIEGGSDE